MTLFKLQKLGKDQGDQKITINNMDKNLIVISWHLPGENEENHKELQSE
jgi:hypothetical protein